MTADQLLSVIAFYQENDHPIPIDLIAEATELGLIIPEGN